MKNIEIEPKKIGINIAVACSSIKFKFDKIKMGKIPNKIPIPPILTIDLLCCFLLLGLSTRFRLRPTLLINGTEKYVIKKDNIITRKYCFANFRIF